ncbi:MAG: RDD family protein [Polyangiaceae bacterium]
MISFVLGLGMGLPLMAGGSACRDDRPDQRGRREACWGWSASWLYFAIMESSPRQATVGKLALGLAVTDENGRRIGFGRATGRYFAKIISSIILLIGFMMVGWTARKQGLHDLIAGTLVYKSRNPEAIGVDVEAFR